jgi:ankyrin repeat protein
MRRGAGAGKCQRARAEANELTETSRAGDLELCRQLIAKGADKEMKDNDGDTALYIACGNGHSEMVKLLIESGVGKETVTSIHGSTPLIIACAKGHFEVVKMLIESGVDKDKEAGDGSTPLIVACQAGHSKVAKLLIESVVDTDKEMSDGYYTVTPRSSPHVNMWSFRGGKSTCRSFRGGKAAYRERCGHGQSDEQ